MRGMGLVPVNPQKVTSMVGHSPDIDNEFLVTHLSYRLGKTSGGQMNSDHRGNRRPEDDTAGDRRLNDRTGNRGKGDEIENGDKGHQGWKNRSDESKTSDDLEL